VTWASVGIGQFHTCATRTDHTVWCWGRNADGQLGLGNAGDGTERLVPTRVGAGTSWAAVSLGGWHTCALRTTHTLWCWGSNALGAVGVAGPNRSTPTRVGTVSTWATVSVGSDHSCATRTTHTLWCWGANYDGQLGLSSGLMRSAPTQVGSAVTWAALGAGQAHTCATRRDHSLWCWGTTRRVSSVSARPPGSAHRPGWERPPPGAA